MKKNQIIRNVDVLVTSKTKLDAFFPIEQFKIQGLSTPFRRHCDQYGGGPLAFVREDIPAKHVSSESTPIEGIYIELNFPKKNWLCCAYNPDKHITNHVDDLRRSLDSYSTICDNLMVIGELNAEVNVEIHETFP